MKWATKCWPCSVRLAFSRFIGSWSPKRTTFLTSQGSCGAHVWSAAIRSLPSISSLRRIGGPLYRKSASQFLSFVLGDFIVNAMLNPDLKLSDRVLRLRVREAVRDFLRLHPESEPAR